MPTHTFTASLWDWPTPRATWVFVTLPQDVADAITAMPRPPRKGFGTIRVQATIGGTTWSTSIAPDSTTGGFMLPIKKSVREAERLELGRTAEITLSLIE